LATRSTQWASQLMGACLFAALVASPADASSDAALKQRLVGVWIEDPAHQDAYIKDLESRGLFMSVRFEADGAGITLVRQGSYCGQILQRYDFRWDIVNNVLISTRDAKIVSRDQVISITRTSYLLVNLTRPEIGREYRSRIEECGTS